MAYKRIDPVAELFFERREALGLEAPEVARRAGISASSYWRYEAGYSQHPKLENLLAIADVLTIPHTDIFAALGSISKDELPALRPYLHAKYPDLLPDVVEKIEVFFAALSEQYDICFDSDSKKGSEPQEEKHK